MGDSPRKGFIAQRKMVLTALYKQTFGKEKMTPYYLAQSLDHISPCL